MIEFGKTLREAREAKGYSVSQLAEITHILPQIIENLEKEDFTRIVAPIYGRGFVKLYCESVGLDPQPLVAEFMEIFNGNRPPVIRLKGTEPVSAEPPSSPAAETVPPAPPIAEEPPVSPEADDNRAAEPPPGPELQRIEPSPGPVPPPEPEPMSFDFDPLPEPPADGKPLEHPMRASEPFKPGPNDLPFPEDAPEPRRDYRLPGHAMSDVPRIFWRFGVLIAAAATILALVFFGCRALYRATMQVPEESEEEKVEAGGEGEQRNGSPSSAHLSSSSSLNPQPSTPRVPRTPRKPIAVPPLYID